MPPPKRRPRKPASKAPLQYALTVYQGIETRVKKRDLASLLARWECGRMLLEERGGAKRLPNGRLEQLSNALDSSRVELANRMQFAAQYTTEAQVRAAYKERGSWYAICRSGLGRRGARRRVPRYVRTSSFEMVGKYQAIMGRIRAPLRSHSVAYYAMWLTALQHGIEQELYDLERRSPQPVERPPNLFHFIDHEENTEATSPEPEK